MSDSDKHIPTLDEMIFPGRPEKTRTTTQETTSTDTTQETTGETAAPDAGAGNERPKRTSFEAILNQQIDTILARHMKAARAEIVRAVMLELRSRLPVTNRKKK